MRVKFNSTLPISKSIANRSILVFSYIGSKNIKLKIKSLRKKNLSFKTPEDINLAFDFLDAWLKNKKTYYVGSSAFLLKAFILRVSRKQGDYFFNLRSGLSKRKFDSFLDLLSQLNVKIKYLQNKKSYIVSSKGWKSSDNFAEIKVDINADDSSQHVSCLVLNSWYLPNWLSIKISNNKVSLPYLKMSLILAKRWGMKAELFDKKNKKLNGVLNDKILEKIKFIKIPPEQSPKKWSWYEEYDMSAGIAIAAFGAFGAKVKVKKFKLGVLQGDKIFLKICKKIGVHYINKHGSLTFYKSEKLKSINLNLKKYPDLFPVLAIILAFAEGKSKLNGAPHLKNKETQRISKVAELLALIKVKYDLIDDGIIIYGKKLNKKSSFEFEYGEMLFDAEDDHRLVMAAAILRVLGFPIKIKGSNAVNKSFPEFLNIFKKDKFFL